MKSSTTGGSLKSEGEARTPAAILERAQRNSRPVADMESNGSIIELTGRVKWFDDYKGFGFIVPDNGMEDVLLHVECLRRDGYETVHEGARVVCEVVENQKRLKCVRILSMDESTAINPATTRSGLENTSVASVSGLEQVSVKWFDRKRGYGFLTRGEGKPDIFIHTETLQRCNIAELSPGQKVKASFGEGRKGLVAIEVCLDNTN